jgi:mono/diheme cytochrome c family protein
VAKSFVAGFLVGVLLLVGGLYYYFASGMAPAAAGDSPMPFEKKLAQKALNAHIQKQSVPSPSVTADEPNLLAGAKVYKENCAGCHGLPGQTPPVIANAMYPHATLLFKGKGVTDDPASESYWKAVNGIRLTGMPSFKNALTDAQLWQVSQLVAHSNEISDSVKKELMPEPAPATQPPAPAPARARASKQE